MIDPYDSTFADDLSRTLARDAEVARLRFQLDKALEHLNHALCERDNALWERDQALARLDEDGTL
jgi:hypothetical protein